MNANENQAYALRIAAASCSADTAERPAEEDIRRKTDHGEKYSVRLEYGSYLLMKSGLQEPWEHRIPKSTKPMQARINLTFR